MPKSMNLILADRRDIRIHEEAYKTNKKAAHKLVDRRFHSHGLRSSQLQLERIGGHSSEDGMDEEIIKDQAVQ